jgi:catechol 2,3-dioxygenase-like lactoylglutathione lyase family enzyme
MKTTPDDLSAKGIAIVRNVDHYGVSVTDMDQAIAFYTRALGADLLWQVGPFHETPTGAEIDQVEIATLRLGPNLNVELLAIRAPGQNRQVPATIDIGAAHLAFFVDYLEAAGASVAAHGGTMLGQPVNTAGEPKRGERIWYLKTPWGAFMELLWRPAHLPMSRKRQPGYTDPPVPGRTEANPKKQNDVRSGVRIHEPGARGRLEKAGGRRSGVGGPPVLAPALQAALKDFTDAIAAQAQGGTAATAAKNQAAQTLIGLLRQLALYVQTTIQSNPAYGLAELLSSGFDAASTSRAQTPLDTPSINGIDNSGTGQLTLRVTPISNARLYKAQSQTAPNAATGADAVGEWTSAGMYQSTRGMVVTGLIPGGTYNFRVRAVGGSTS